MIIANNKYWKQLTFSLVDLHKYYRLNLRKWYAGRVTDIGAESEIGELSSDSSLSFCVHFHTNFFEKGMNPSLLDTPSSKVDYMTTNLWERKLWIENCRKGDKKLFYCLYQEVIAIRRNGICGELWSPNPWRNTHLKYLGIKTCIWNLVSKWIFFLIQSSL